MVIREQGKKDVILHFLRNGDQNPDMRANPFRLLKAAIQFAGFSKIVSPTNLWYSALDSLCDEGVLKYTKEFGYDLGEEQRQVISDVAVEPALDLSARTISEVSNPRNAEENVSGASTLAPCCFAMSAALSELAAMVDKRFTGIERALGELKERSGVGRVHQEILEALETIRKKRGGT